MKESTGKRNSHYRFYTDHNEADVSSSQVFDPAEGRQRPNIIGKIDLDAANKPTRPDSALLTDGESAEFFTSTVDREDIRRKVEAWQPNWKRIRKNVCNIAIEYADGQPLRVNLKNDVTAYAIGCLDPLNQTVGYYIAVNLYGPGVITKMSDKMMPDGVMAGEWSSETVKSVTLATGGECAIINSLLLPQIEKERALFHEMLVDEFYELAEEQQRRMEEERKRKEEDERLREKQEALARIEEQRQKLVAENDELFDSYPMAVPSDELAHLPYVRQQKTMRYSDWPRIDGEVQSARYFDGMKTISYIIESQDALPTYILSRAYVREMVSRRDELMMRFVNYRQLLNGEPQRHGVLCYNVASVDVTIIYDVIAPVGEAKEFIRFAVINDDQLICTYTSYRPNTAVQPYVTHLGMLTPIDPRFSKIKDICNRTIEKIIMHIMLEQQTEALTRSESDGSGNSGNSGKSVESAPDIFLRTAAWYNSVTVPATEVVPYESHRWKGTGESKTLEPVTVSGYTKGAYTRSAQCEK